MRLTHASLDQLAFGIRTQARLHQPVENAKLRQVLPRQQQSADARSFQIEIHDQHVAPALGLVRCENGYGTGPADTTLDAVKRQNRRDAGKWRPPAGSPILAHDTPVDDGNPPPCGIGTRGCDVDLLLHGDIVSERRIEQVVGDSDRRDRRVAPQDISGFGVEASHLLGFDRRQEEEREPSVDVPDEPMFVQRMLAQSGADEPDKRAQCVVESDRAFAGELHHSLSMLAALMI